MRNVVIGQGGLRGVRARVVGAVMAAAIASSCTPRGAVHEPSEAARPLTLGPADPLEVAAKKIAEGKAAEALAILEGELEARPGDHELWFSKGVALREMGAPDRALAAWEEALRIEPDFFAALHAQGAVYLEREAWSDAIVALNAAAVAKPDFADAHYNLALALVGAAGAGERGPDALAQATAALTTASALAPTDLDITLLRVDLDLKRGRVAEAAPRVAAAVRSHPEDPAVHAAAGRVALKQGQGQAARAAFERALELAPGDAGFELGRAQALLRLGEAQEAEGRLAALAERAPDSAVVWLEWGTALAKQGKLEPALEKLDEAVRRGPHLVSAQVRRIGVLSDLGRCRAATAALGSLRTKPGAGRALEAAETAVAGCLRRSRP